MSANIVQLRQAESTEMRPVSHPVGRQANEVYRVREHLTEAEMARLLATLKLPFPIHVHMPPALDRIRTGGSRNGYTTAPALPGPRLDHEHGALHGDVAGAVQGHLARLDRRGSLSMGKVPAPLARRLTHRDCSNKDHPYPSPTTL